MAKVVIGGVYKHISGLEYKVKKILLNATGYENSNQVTKFVLYIQLEGGKYPAGTEWVRDEKDFLHNFKLINDGQGGGVQ